MKHLLLDPPSIMKHLLLEIVEATEAAAIAAAKYVGSGDKLMIDKVATDAMRDRLNLIRFSAQIAIGEGKKDESIGLYNGERVGLHSRGKHYSHDINELPPPDDDPRWEMCDYDYEIAVDPVDGTTQTAKGGYEAMSVIALGSKSSMLETESFYMNKLAVGSQVAKHMKPSVTAPIEDTISAIRHILGKKQITVCMLDRPRHDEIAKRVRESGCRIKFIQDCDVSGAIAAALPESGIDLFVGIGGAPEGVIAAAALKCLGGYFEGLLVDNKTYKDVGHTVIDGEGLAKGNVMFAATGITNGSLLKGVRHEGTGVITNSIIMESASKSLKRIESYYELGSI